MIAHPDCQGRECGTWEQCTGNPCVPIEIEDAKPTEKK